MFISFFLVVGIKRVFANAPPAHCHRVLGYALCRQSAFLIVIEKKEKHVELLQCFALQDRMDDVKIFTFQLRYRANAHAPQLKAGWVFSPTMNIHVRPLSPRARENNASLHKGGAAYAAEGFSILCNRTAANIMSS